MRRLTAAAVFIAAVAPLLAAAPFKELTVRDFEIDGPALARQQTGVMITGAYTKIGEVEALYADRVAAATATYTNSDYARQLPYVPLLTDSANHFARETMLGCRERNDIGCTLTLHGIVTQCTQSTVFGGQRTVPCLQVFAAEMPSAKP